MKHTRPRLRRAHHPVDDRRRRSLRLSSITTTGRTSEPTTPIWKPISSLIETVDKIPLDMYDPKWKIYTKSEELPAVKVGSKAVIKQALLSNGSIVAGSVERSVLSPGVIVHPLAKVDNCVLFNNVEMQVRARSSRTASSTRRRSSAKTRMLGFGDRHDPEQGKSGTAFLRHHRPRQASSACPKGMEIGRNCRIFDTADLADCSPTTSIPSGSTLR
ncbi:MAG: hypothetical protein MZU97_01550 [Bacillus subtilis]|nr:hypothetical protein [Bacillus subtilis]